MIRPTTFGYFRLGRTPTGLPRRDPSVRRRLERFTEREGFTLAQTFIDAMGSPRRVALDSLAEAAIFTEIAAVIIPYWSHLGSDRTAQLATQQMIVDVCGVPVLAADTDPPPVVLASQRAGATT